MGELNGFNIYEQQPTNQDIKIIFNPEPIYQSYKLTIIKDNETYKEIKKINSNQTQVTLSETGEYKIEVTYYDEYMNETIINSGIYIIDKEVPKLTIEKEYIELTLGKKLDIMSGVSATDAQEGNLTNNIKTNIKEIKLNEEGIKKIIYKVSDKAGNEATEEVVVNVIPTSPTIIIFQTMFIAILFILIIGIIIYNKSVKIVFCSF